jgi:hypothetical protein
MASGPKLFISHTTHDQRDHILADRLAKGLRQRGASVWIAPESIPAGAEWRARIVSAILNECTHFLVILSAASTNARWVLKEIQLVKQRCEQGAACTILPLVAGQLSSYRGMEFIDRFQTVPYHENFSAQLDVIARQLRLPPCGPDEFRSFIDKKTDGFVGRGYVYTTINEFFRREDSGYFIIQGDPGEGKSAILSQYVKDTGCIAYFNFQAEGFTRPDQFLDSVRSQLVTRYGLSENARYGDSSGEGGRLRRLLEEASSQLSGGQRLVIAVDALDEVDQTTQAPGANILYLPSLLPTNVYFVMTRRRLTIGDMPLYVTSPLQTLDLIDYAEKSVEDIGTYIRRASKRRNLRAWLSARKITTDEFASKLSQKSECNFMYLCYVLSEIERGVHQDLSIDTLPTGLEGYYESHWHRMRVAGKTSPRAKLDMVYLLCEVREPVSRDLILRFLRERYPKTDSVTVQEVLDDWHQFLHLRDVEGQIRYSIYHSSFRDFLHRKDIVKAAGVAIHGIRRMIANNLFRELFPGETRKRTGRHAAHIGIQHRQALRRCNGQE